MMLFRLVFGRREHGVTLDDLVAVKRVLVGLLNGLESTTFCLECHFEEAKSRK